MQAVKLEMAVRMRLARSLLRESHALAKKTDDALITRELERIIDRLKTISVALSDLGEPECEG